MSRVGRAVVYFDKSVQVTVTPKNEVIVKGAKVSQTVCLRPSIQAKVEDGKVTLSRTNEERETRAFHGMSRALIQNAVRGVTAGWTKELEINGVGYRAQVAGKKLQLTLGFSHPIEYTIPSGIEVKVDKNTRVIVTGASRELVGQVAAEIRSYRPPEPFLGKGVKYVDEHIRRKAGKSAAKA